MKINTVFIPQINFEQIEIIAKKAATSGAALMNIIPLIPLYKFRNLRPPSCEEMQSARNTAEKYIPQFRLCKQCRADAIGILGNSPLKTNKLLEKS